MFINRIEAGMLLAEKLEKYRNDPGVILAVPRGGVPVAYAVARQLGLPLEVILTKKIGHPANREYAIGAVSLTDEIIIPHNDVSESYIENEIKNVRETLRKMYVKFMGEKEPEKLTGKTVIVVDDGIATGNTLLATINMLRKSEPEKIIIAVPVAAREAFEKLSTVADEIVAVLVPESFYGVGAFYKDFEQVTDEEVMYYLDKLRQLKKTG